MIRIEGISQLRINVKPAARLVKLVERVDSLDWRGIGKELDQQGNAMIEQLLSLEECRAIAGLYPNDEIFRSRVVMGRHGFGRGEYKYFSYPLPDLLGELRTAVYSHLVPVANHWNEAMGIDLRYPKKHADFVEHCHHAGQVRPTPLLLQYGVGDYNCLHQDIYGEHVFPLQLAILLSDPGADFTGGEFVMTESVRACRAGRWSCRSVRATPLFSQFITGPFRVRAARIASTCGTASAASGRDTVIQSASFSMTRHNGRAHDNQPVRRSFEYRTERRARWFRCNNSAQFRQFARDGR